MADSRPRGIVLFVSIRIWSESLTSVKVKWQIWASCGPKVCDWKSTGELVVAADWRTALVITEVFKDLFHERRGAGL